MVTFAFPGENEAAGANSGTPLSRPPLPFAKRSFANSPFGGSPTRPLGTPRTATSANQGVLGREESSGSTLTNNNIAAARNIFRASSITDNPSPTIFSPSLPASTMKKVFAPSATPEPARTYRDSTAAATPRGMAAKTSSEELFNMRIPSPSNDLSGEALTRKIPKDWASKNSIYADQYLQNLCPPEFDDEQRRQFFCILDLRRLKHAADEIFSKRDWKLNVLNFAKEFEKSRSIILLRYGLYKFQNVQPSKEVMKRWRREHGLPEPEEEADESTPSKPKSTKKRKADQDASTSRKRKTVEEEPLDTVKSTPVPAKNKKRTFVEQDDEDEEEQEQPSKLQKSSTETTPSAAKSLFEKIANSKASGPTAASFTKPNAFPPSVGKSVFSNLKPSAAASSASPGNIFGHLSDNSAQNSGVEADAESESDSDAEKDEEPSAGTSAGESSSQATSNLFGKKTQDSDAGTRESTPGRSLFERVAKGQNGELKRADAAAEPQASKPIDQTWNPSTTPIKFAPTSSNSTAGGIFGANKTAAPAGGNLFGSKAPASNASTLFGAAASKKDEPAAESTSATQNKEQGESDKENEALTTATKPAFGGSSVTPTPASTLFGAKPASNEPTKAPVSTKPAPALFGSSTPSATSASNLFGASKAAESSAPTVTQSSTLFGAKPAEAAKPATDSSSMFGGAKAPAESQPPSNPFGGSSTPASSDQSSSNLFAAKPASTSSSLFGGSSSTPSAQTLFGGSSTPAPDAGKTDAAKLAAAPVFSFGQANGNSQSGTKPMFAPKSPPASGTANLFGGSPMKQDEPSPAKRSFTGGSASDSVPKFAFGGGQNGSAGSLFGAANEAPNNEPGSSGIFGGQSQGTASAGSSFNFNFGGGNSANSSFNNPFANNPGAGNAGADGNNNGAGVNGSTSFGFGAGGSNPPSGSPSPFQFGGSTNGTSSTPAFGASGDSGKPASASIFNFGGASQASSGSVTGTTFGNNNPNPPSFGNLQPPTGGSTTGTNTPFTLGGGGSSLATTPAAGTPEPSGQGEGGNSKTGETEEGKVDDQVNLTEGSEADEETLHEVRAKALKFVKESDGEDKKDVKSKSPWSTQGVGSLKLLKHKETNAVRLLLRAEPRGNVAMNRSVLPDFNYEANEKYVKLMTSNDKGDGLETWMIQVKTKDLAKALAEKLEENKESNKT